MRSFPGIFLSLTMANAGESRAFIGLGASFGFEGAAKAALKEDQNNTNSVTDTTKRLGGGAELLGGQVFLYREDRH